MKRVVLVTGAAKGIGAAIAREFSANGDTVLIHCNRSYERAEQLRNELNAAGGDAHVFQADLSCAEGAERLFADIRKCFRRIDVLVNNAGIAEHRLLTDTAPEDYRQMLDVNFGSVYFCCRQVLPMMLSAGHGAIVNVSSVWGRLGAACECLYSAAKAAVIGFTKALAKEVGLSGIRVNCIAPGYIETDMTASLGKDAEQDFVSRTALNRTGTAEEVAKLAFFLADEKSAYVTGQCISVDGGY